MDSKMLAKPRRNPPTPGQIVGYVPGLDPGGDRIADNLDFVAIKALLDAALDGDAEALLELNSEMEGRDERLKQVAKVRRASLTGLAWEVDPVDTATDEASKALAIKAADYIRAELQRITTFRTLLRKMATAIGPNLAVTEIVWGAGSNAGRVVQFNPIGHQRLRIDYADSPDVLVKTEHDQDGIEQPFAKFITHIPDDVGDRIFSNTITRAQAPIWVAKKFAMQDWVTFCEIFGMPVRVARYQKGATKGEKTEALTALAAMGSKAYMLLSHKFDYEMKEVQRSSDPYQAFMEWAERSQAIGYLGQNLTTDTTGSGGLGGAGAASVHQDTKRLLTEEDAESENATLREQLFSPMLRFRFPDQHELMPVPMFRRIWRDATTNDIKAQTIRTATQDLGLPVGRAWVYKELGIAEPEKDEATIERLAPLTVPGGPGGF